MKYQKIAVIAAKNNIQAIKTKDALIDKYTFLDLTFDHKKTADIDLIIAIGGDGLMLHLLHEFEAKPLPIYGINCGTIGFLMNSFDEENFLKKIENSKESIIRPLRMNATDSSGNIHSHIAINEVSLLRQSSQAAKIKIEINDLKRMEELIADGILLATSAGSTAYNFSAGGAIIPFDAKILALTPISPFRPRKWRGALLPSNSKIKFFIADFNLRPVSATADAKEIKNVKEVEICEDSSISFKILFDCDHSLDERIIREQFNS